MIYIPYVLEVVSTGDWKRWAKERLWISQNGRYTSASNPKYVHKPWLL